MSAHYPTLGFEMVNRPEASSVGEASLVASGKPGLLVKLSGAKLIGAAELQASSEASQFGAVTQFG